jgi:hypothetical protein
MAAWPAKPAARDVVAHATAEQAVGVRVGAESLAGVREDSTRNLENNSMNL